MYLSLKQWLPVRLRETVYLIETVVVGETERPCTSLKQWLPVRLRETVYLIETVVVGETERDHVPH